MTSRYFRPERGGKRKCPWLSYAGVTGMGRRGFDLGVDEGVVVLPLLLGGASARALLGLMAPSWPELVAYPQPCLNLHGSNLHVPVAAKFLQMVLLC